MNPVIPFIVFLDILFTLPLAVGAYYSNSFFGKLGFLDLATVVFFVSLLTNNAEALLKQIGREDLTKKIVTPIERSSMFFVGFVICLSIFLNEVSLGRAIGFIIYVNIISLAVSLFGKTLFKNQRF